MKRLVELLSQPEFQVFLFCLMFLLLNWPFLAVAREGGLKTVFLYLYGLWSVVILLLFLIQKSLRAKKTQGDGNHEEGS